MAQFLSLDFGLEAVIRIRASQGTTESIIIRIRC